MSLYIHRSGFIDEFENILRVIKVPLALAYMEKYNE